MSALPQKAALTTLYQVPPSQLAQVRVAASAPVDVYAMGPQELEAFKAKQEFTPYRASRVAKEHSFVVELPPVRDWLLVIQNPWSHDVEVTYTVVSLAKGPVGVVGSTSGLTGIPTYVSSSVTRS